MSEESDVRFSWIADRSCTVTNAWRNGGNVQNTTIMLLRYSGSIRTFAGLI